MENVKRLYNKIIYSWLTNVTLEKKDMLMVCVTAKSSQPALSKGDVV